MFGSVILEVGIGLILAFLLFSIILTSAQEGIESLLKGRAKDLERAIGELLDKGADANIVKQFYEHPMIYPLYSGTYAQGSRTLPSYIPSASFATAVADIASKASVALPGTNSQKALTPTQRITDAYNLANTVTRSGAATALSGLESWYDSAMERLTGQYKRKTQAWLFGIGFLAAAFGNINPIAIGDRLARDQQLRANIVGLAPLVQKQAETVLKMTAPNDPKPDWDHATTNANLTKAINNELKQDGLPIGWADRPFSRSGVIDWAFVFRSIPGWLISALAGMLGAPFWFDMLNRFMNLRAALKPDQR